jgi:hypothetical protein
MGELQVSDAAIQAAKAFGEALKDREFRAALDALSCDVLNLCSEFLDDHRGQIAQHCADVRPDHIISAVVGWILGMPAGRMATKDAQLTEAFQHNAIAAVVAGWSAENSSRVHAAEGKQAQ